MSTPQIATSTMLMVDEDLHVHHLTLASNESNSAIIARIRSLLAQEPSSSQDFLRKIMYALLMRKPAVGKGLMLKARDIEAQTIALQHVYKIKKDDTLTKLLFGSGPTPETGCLYVYLVNGVQEYHAGYTEVWCIYYAASGHAASVWLLVALGIAVMIGFGVGLGVGDGELGLNIGTGVFAVFTGVHLAIVLGMV